MPEKVTVSTALVQQLIDRIDALEKKIDGKAQKDTNKTPPKQNHSTKTAD